MKPVRTVDTNMLYKRPADQPQHGDLPCVREGEGLITSTWWLTDDEREAIANGANIRMTQYGEPIHPVELALTDRVGIGEDHPTILRRIEFLKQDRETA